MKVSRRVVIVGGVAGGASAAARLRRLDEKAEIILFERGENVTFANCGLPYHIGGEIIDRAKLVLQTPKSLKDRFRLDVRVRHEVLAIRREKKTVLVRDLVKQREFEQSYDELILSPGAAPILPRIPGIQLPGVQTLRTLADMDPLMTKVESLPQGRVAVVGAGFIGLEMAEAFQRRGWEVLLVEKLPQVMGPADAEMALPLLQTLRANKVRVLLNAGLESLEKTENGRLSARIGEATEVVDMVLMSVGVKPETRLAEEAGLALGQRRGIQVDAHMRTNDPSIFAVGDAVEVKDVVTAQQGLMPLAGPANRQGRIAADNICGIPSAYRGTQGTAIVRVFDAVLGMTGASEKSLLAQGRRYEKVYLHPSTHAGYYPGATPLKLKILFDPQNGRLLGAQASGMEGVDKLIDSFAVALQAGFDMEDLEEVELTYAPPFGSAKSAVNFAGFVADNVRTGRMGLFHCEEAESPRPDQMLLDVRTPQEYAQGSIPGAVNIPVDELRGRLEELPKDKELLVFCKVGIRGYVAFRLLSQHGYKSRNLSGGWLTWKDHQDAKRG